MYEDSENSAALAKLAREIHEDHEKAGEALRQGLEHALNAGRLLLEARSLALHSRYVALDSLLADRERRAR